MREKYTKVPIEDIWTEEDKIFLNFKEQFETVTGLDFIQCFFQFAQTYQTREWWWKDEDGQHFIRLPEGYWNATN